MQIFFKIFFQSLRISLEELMSAKMRSFLSLLGISIGIVCVISVRTAVNSLERNVKDSFASFGNDIFYIQKWPWAMDKDYPWWRYFNRPSSNPKEAALLKQRVSRANAVCMINMAGDKKVKFEDRLIENVMLRGATFEYDKVRDLDFSQGRYFTQTESDVGINGCLIGAKVAENLFEGFTEIEGKEIRVDGIKLKIIGVIKKQGEDMFGLSVDNNVIVPYPTFNLFMDKEAGDPLVAITPKPGANMEELKYELKGAMRTIRRLSPQTEDNFAINQMTVFTESIAGIFSIINIAGIIIGLFSLIVGGVGIANIMFVSVKERTNIIGIKMALGAKRAYILLEFLLESILLCVLGGIIGLVVVILIFKILGWFILHVGESSFKFYITPANLILGVSISIFIGIVAGFIPAYRASNMKPVDAIRGG